MIFFGLHNLSWRSSFQRFLCMFFLYLLSLHLIVGWYKILDVKRNPLIGQSLTGQLHNFCDAVGLGCTIFLSPFIFDLFGMQEKLSFIVFLLKSFTNLWFGGKCLLNNLMNIIPILVFTDLLYSELNRVMLRFLFFLFWSFSLCCWCCSLILYPLCFRDFS